MTISDRLPCSACDEPYHRYCPEDPEHEYVPTACINSLRDHIEALEAAAPVMHADHHTHVTALEHRIAAQRQELDTATKVIRELKQAADMTVSARRKLRRDAEVGNLVGQREHLMAERDSLRAERDAYKEALDRAQTNAAKAVEYLNIFRRALPERYTCRLCGATEPDAGHKPNCELTLAGAALSAHQEGSGE